MKISEERRLIMDYFLVFVMAMCSFFTMVQCQQDLSGPSEQREGGITYKFTSGEVTEIPENSMRDLPPNVETLQMSDNKITILRKKDFPEGCCLQLSFINLHNNFISTIEEGIFENLPSLVKIDLTDNIITEFPNLKAKKLQTIEMRTNLIKRIDPEAMRYYKKLWHLDVSFNKIERIEDDTFEDNNEMVFLSLKNNPLKFIAERGLPEKVEYLHLDNTLLEKLPSQKGIKNLLELYIKNVQTLFTIPEPSKFQKLKKIQVTYSMHCCAFMDQEQIEDDGGEVCNSSSIREVNEKPSMSHLEMKNTTSSSNETSDDDMLSNNGWMSDGIDGSVDEDPLSKFIDRLFGTEEPNSVESNSTINLCELFEKKTIEEQAVIIQCTPKPDAFNPCQDVMGTHALRAFSWIISIFAIIGNLFQLIILFYSRQDLTVYKLLMYNLGFANLMLGMYLLVLCCVDTYTYGKYYNFVQSWQYSGGCQAFGFIAMFATQLSFCSLVLITIERFLLIIFALQVGNQMKLKHAKIAVLCVWLYSFIVAILPVTGKVSSYSKIAICLPVDVPTKVALGYVVWVLLAYVVAFFIIVICYIKMYFSISKVRPGCSSNTIDIQVAKRMALIIFSNFLCWLPISIAGFIALSGNVRLDIDVSKFLVVFIFPLNACTNPFLYAIFTKVFRGDTLALLSSCGLCKKADSNYRNRAPSNYLKAKPKQRADTSTKHFMHYEPPSQSAGYFDRRNIEAQTEFASPETPIKVMIDPNKGDGIPDSPIEEGKPRSDSTRGLLEDHKVVIDPRFRSESNDTCSTGMSVQSTDSEVYNEFSRMIGSVKSENFLV